MDIQVFLSLLVSLSAVSGLITEAVKRLFIKSEGASYNLIALITGIIVGMGGIHTYAFLNLITFDSRIFIYSILMGIAAALSSMIGYDKIKQLILQLQGK